MDLSIALYGKFMSNTHTFFACFIWSVNCSRDFFSHFSASKLYELSLWIREYISEMSSYASLNLYLRPCTISIKSSICTVCTMSELSGLWIVNIWSLNYALHFGSVNIDLNYLYWSVFSTDINRNIIFDYLLLFKLFWLCSKFYELSQ